MGGWDGSGNVVRDNGDGTGDNVWQQDKAAAREVTAARHDIHDQFLADAIEKTLNRDGENAMAANLPMGGFGFSNIGALGGNLTNFDIGTWVPALSGTGHTYFIQRGLYVRFNDQCLLYGELRVTTVGTGVLSTGLITGLPFTSDLTYRGAVSLTYFSSITTSAIQLGGWIDTNSTAIRVAEMANDADPTSIGQADLTEGGATTDFIFHGIYPVQ